MTGEQAPAEQQRGRSRRARAVPRRGHDVRGGEVGLLGGDAALLDGARGGVADRVDPEVAGDPTGLVDRDEAVGVVREPGQVRSRERGQRDDAVDMGCESREMPIVPWRLTSAWTAVCSWMPADRSSSATPVDASGPKASSGADSGVTMWMSTAPGPLLRSSSAVMSASS